MRRVLFFLWLGAIALIILLWKVSGSMSTAALDPIKVVAWIVAIVLSMFWGLVVARWLMRVLFWRVGRRLALSYVFVGALPFVFFAILLFFAGYLMGYALTFTAVRTERQATLTRMDRWNLEYSLSGQLPPGESIELYDSAAGEETELPIWLRDRSFNGMAARDGDALFVSSRVYALDGTERTITLVMPANETWAAGVLERTGMEVMNFSTWEAESAGGENADERTEEEADNEADNKADNEADNKADASGVHLGADTDTVADKRKGPRYSVDIGQEKTEFSGEDGNLIGGFLRRNLKWGTILAFDMSASLVEWESGLTNEEKKLTTVIANPVLNLRDTYFGGQDIAESFITATLTVGGMLFFVYGLAALFAGVMIFSVSRAVNRIEKGTKAVEQGDFSYRIRMKPRNQLGEVAQSFDRMTESIASLLHRVAEQERLQSEIDIAASIQRNLLPKEGPTARGVSFAAHFEPSAAIGGDYYDVFSLDRSRLAVAIGDVSGHGLSTGLVMAMVKAAMTTLVEEGVTEEALFRRLNDLVYSSTDRRAFMTLGFTIFDLERKVVRHTNAGHLYPYILRNGEEPFSIEGPSLPLGVRPSIEPHTEELDLCEGDTFVYLSDGIVEAQNEDRDPYGFEVLEELLAGLVGQRPAEVQTAILEAINAHAGERTADDDRTVMILRFDELEGLHTREEVLREITEAEADD